MLALRDPATVGVKVTVYVQVPPAATPPDPVGLPTEQLSRVRAKSPGLEPASIDAATSVSDAVPLLVTVTVCGVLVVLIVWVEKVRLEGDGLKVGKTPGFVELGQLPAGRLLLNPFMTLPEPTFPEVVVARFRLLARWRR